MRGGPLLFCFETKLNHPKQVHIPMAFQQRSQAVAAQICRRQSHNFVADRLYEQPAQKNWNPKSGAQYLECICLCGRHQSFLTGKCIFQLPTNSNEFKMAIQNYKTYSFRTTLDVLLRNDGSFTIFFLTFCLAIFMANFNFKFHSSILNYKWWFSVVLY